MAPSCGERASPETASTSHGLIMAGPPPPQDDTTPAATGKRVSGCSGFWWHRSPWPESLNELAVSHRRSAGMARARHGSGMVSVFQTKPEEVARPKRYCTGFYSGLGARMYGGRSQQWFHGSCWMALVQPSRLSHLFCLLLVGETLGTLRYAASEHSQSARHRVNFERPIGQTQMRTRS